MLGYYICVYFVCNIFINIYMFKYVFENEIDVILKNCVICEKWYYEMIEFIFVNE